MVGSYFDCLMEQILPCLHPNPGWSNAETQGVKPPRDSDEAEMVGKHCILELYDCDQNKLNDEAFIRTTLTFAAKYAGATLLNLITHHFEPQGVTGYALLEDSHISIHTWPELGLAKCDIFCCGEHSRPKEAVEYLHLRFKSQELKRWSCDRSIPSTIVSST